MDVPVGTSVYTAMLNARGGFESDLTVQRLAHDRFMVVTGSSQTTRDMDWITRRLPENAHAALTDVTGAWSVLGVMGPNARKLLSRVSRAALDDAAFPFGTCRDIDIGAATVLALRRTYVGELGWELYVPVEMTVPVYDALCAAGADLGLRDAGYYAIESLRLEKGYRAWGRELTPDHNPYEAGLGFAVKLDKGVPFIGQAALRTLKTQPLKRRCASIVLEDEEAIAHGGELMLRDGQPAGETTSAAWGHTLGRTVMLGYVHADGQPVDAAWLSSGTWEVDIGGKRCACRLSLKPPYDPEGRRPRPLSP
jgi:4-methylaminobutanoate oxidase (formaldehyde-forming)